MADKIHKGLEMLLEEIDAIILELNHQGTQLLKEKQYTEAKKIIEKAETILAFQTKLHDLREEWIQEAVPSSLETRKTKKPVSHTIATPLEPGLRTPMEAYQLPILHVLIKLGGSGGVGKVLDLVEDMMKDKLNKYDYQPIPSNPNTIRWRKTAQWSRYSLVQEGYLASDSPRGVWEVTQAGRQRVEGEAMNYKSVSENTEKFQTKQKEFGFSKEVVTFKVGEIYHRQQDLHDKFGGNRQSGIAPCAEAPVVFLFTSPSGDEFGYEDGWVSDKIYHYFGEGQTGNMEMSRGNRAIRDHEAEGRELHLFEKVDTGRYKYVGQFQYLKHEIVEGLDAEKKHRDMIRFLLKKVET